MVSSSLNVLVYDCSPNNLRITSYMPNMIAALGTVRRRCGVRPPYMEAIPSSFQTSLKHCTKPVYFGLPPSIVGA
jgi:hypothetical protein